MSVIHLVSEALLRDFEPRQSWLAHDSYLHGVDHMARVFIFQELICQRLESEGITVNREALRWASMTHDVGRIDDGLDIEHGRRSAQWIKENLADKIPSEMLDIVTYIVRWHTPSDREAPEMTVELQVLKDADALDRVRLGDLDTGYLRTNVAPSLVPVAEELFNQYEKVINDSPFEAVVLAAQAVGVVESN